MTIANQAQKTRTVDMKFEVAIIPVSDVDRAKRFSGASVLSASRLEPLVRFPLASPARFSRSVREPD
jgi:hypothetical protein